MKFSRIGLVLLLINFAFAIPSNAATKFPAAFPVAPHSDVSIEWWYLNAHVTTSKGRHLAMIASFFRFGNADTAAKSAKTSPSAAPLSHYLIYAVTDEDTGAHVAYSLADKNTLHMLQQYATMAVMQSPDNKQAQSLLAALNSNKFPGGTDLIPGAAHVAPSPFDARYGESGEVKAVAGKANTFTLTLGKPGSDAMALTFASTRPPMYVGGTGNTGVVKPDDMKYVSLTRCNVSGTINTGSGPETVSRGEGWFDHQWGNTWTTERVGWDWFGVQLDDGRDILFFRQRHMSDGSIFQPSATIEDKYGNLTVTKNITFIPDKESIWESPRTHVKYPLRWVVVFPDQKLRLEITAEAKDQEMPVLASGGAIWEGSCTVKSADSRFGGTSGVPFPITGTGKAYMELVGYSLPVVQKTLADNITVDDYGNVHTRGSN